MQDRLLSAGRTILKIVNSVNWFLIALSVGAMLASFPFAGLILHILAAKYRTIEVIPVLWVMRLAALLGIIGGLAAHVVFARLLAIVETARRGDPFVAVNAGRLQAIGWALLVLQLLDLAFGGLTAWLTLLHVDRLDWSPSVGGWIAVLMVFVLARVFALGARMRDELELTV